MDRDLTTNRRQALKLTGTAALATSVPVLASSPGAGADISDGPAYREWIPTADALGDSDALEYAYLDLEQIREDRERGDDSVTGVLDADDDRTLDSLPTLLRLPLSVTLSLTVSSLGVLLFGNVISVGWDDEDGGPDLSASTLLWVNGVTVIRGSFGAADAAEAIQSERDGYEQVGTKDGFDLYERDHDSRLDAFGRDGRCFAVKDDTLVVSLREDGLDRVETVIETHAGDQESHYEQDEEFDLATRETGDASITTGSVESPEIDGVELSDEVSDLVDARVLVAGIRLIGLNITGIINLSSDSDISDWDVAEAIEDDENLSVDTDGELISVVDQYE